MLVSIKIVKGIKYFEEFSFTERNTKSLPAYNTVFIGLGYFPGHALISSR